MTTQTYQKLINETKMRHPKKRKKYDVRKRFKYEGSKERRIKRLAEIINNYYNFYELPS